MKSFKFLLLFVSLFVLTGCGMTYNLEYKGDTFYETASVSMLTSELIDDSPYTTFNNIIRKYDNMHNFLATYKTKETVGDTTSKLDISAEYSIDSFGNSVLFGLCYKDTNVYTNDSTIIIKTNSKFKCYNNFSELDTVKIQFKTDHKVISHNADNVKNGLYTWNITKQNSIDKSINIVLSKEVYQNRSIINYIIVGVIIIVGGYIGLKLLKLNKRNNKI